ncbi:MAG: serine/threonine protein kinase [bacterium]
MEKIIDNRFELESAPIDEAAMFQVYKAQDTVAKKPVIIKILKDEYAKDSTVVDNFRSYFLDFQTNVKNTKHLAKVSQITGTAGNRVYMVQEFVEGQTLEEFMKKQPNLTAKDFVPIFEQICEGLHFLHIKNLCHYKILPRNILINDDQRVKLVGFGSLSSVLGNKTLVKKVTGDIKGFVAPEILAGTDKSDITAACDIYTLGKVLETLPITKNQDIVAKAIAKDPTQRYQKVRDFKAEAGKLFVEESEAPPDEQKEETEAPDSRQIEVPQIPLQTINPVSPTPFKYKLPISEPDTKVHVVPESLPEFALFDEKTLEFKFNPAREQAGQRFQVQFRVSTDADEQIVELPIQVRKGGLTVKTEKKPDPTQQPVPFIWNLTSSFTVNVKETVQFNVNNPDRNRFRIHLKSRPPEASSAKFDEKSGDFKWKPGKKDDGQHIFLFELVDLQDPNVTETKQVSIEVKQEISTKPEKPKPVSPSGESDLDRIKRSFLWVYNIILFVAGAFGVVLYAFDLFIGFAMLIVAEGVYLLLAANNPKFQEYLQEN